MPPFDKTDLRRFQSLFGETEPYDQPDLGRFQDLFRQPAPRLGRANTSAIIRRYNDPQFTLPAPEPETGRRREPEAAPSRQLNLPPIEPAPEYTPLAREKKTGGGNRLKGFAQGVIEAAYATGGNPFAALAGGVAGAINRDYPERALFNRTTRARALENQERQMAMRRQMLNEANLVSEMDARQMNAEAARRRAEAEFNQPFSQGEILLERDEQGGFRPIVVGGQNVRNAGYARGIEDAAARERRQAAELAAEREKLAQDAALRKYLRERQDAAALARVLEQQRGAMSRTRIQEAGRSARQKASLTGRAGTKEIQLQPTEREIRNTQEFFGVTREEAIRRLQESRY